MEHGAFLWSMAIAGSMEYYHYTEYGHGGDRFDFLMIFWVDVYAAVGKCIIYATSVSSKKFSRITDTLNAS